MHRSEVVTGGGEAVARAFHAAVGAGRWDEAARLFHDDGVLLLPSRPPTVGREAILAFYEAHGRRQPGEQKPLLMTDGNRVMTLVGAEGSDRGGGEVARPWTATIFTIEDGAIRQVRVVFDTAQRVGEEAA